MMVMLCTSFLDKGTSTRMAAKSISNNHAIVIHLAKE
jgi:hypothetical protein